MKLFEIKYVSKYHERHAGRKQNFKGVRVLKKTKIGKKEKSRKRIFASRVRYSKKVVEP